MIDLATELLKAPRHLGIHSGGMVLTDRPVGEVVPIEHARMENRTVIQWDKDDCAWMGLVKFDLLGLGMLAALQYCFDMVAEPTGEAWALATIPKEEQAVYDMLCRADSIGVFQVESRAQMGTLPRLQPRRFYDLVIEIALIRRARSRAARCIRSSAASSGTSRSPTCTPKLEPVLERTLGIPVFQEQLMQIAMAVGDCTGEDADLLRRAMGSKRGVEKIEPLRDEAVCGDGRERHHRRGRRRDLRQIQAFANFGFAESHALQLRAAGLRELVAQAALPGGVPRGAAARPADGVLLAAVARRRRPAPRRRGAPARHRRLRRGCRAGGGRRRSHRADRLAAAGTVVSR